MLSCISGPAFDEHAEIMTILEENSLTTESVYDMPTSLVTSAPRRPLSPKILAPLVIPVSTASPPRLAKQSSTGRLRTGSLPPPDVPPKSSRIESSPHSKASPYTPYTPHSASTLSYTTSSTSVSSTPVSAQPAVISAPNGRSSPKPSSVSPVPNPSTRSRGHSEVSASNTKHIGSSLGHRRGESETSIMDRGRPKKRSDGSPMKRKPSVQALAAAEEQKAFETLPQGHRAHNASTQLPTDEIELLRKQAMGQAARFEVLSSKDVEALSRVSHFPNSQIIYINEC
jgi:hypothetical protein